MCEILNFEPVNGKVILNACLPQLIRQKLNSNSSFLSIILASDNHLSRYWSFPEYKELNETNPHKTNSNLI